MYTSMLPRIMRHPVTESAVKAAKGPTISAVTPVAFGPEIDAIFASNLVHPIIAVGMDGKKSVRLYSVVDNDGYEHRFITFLNYRKVYLEDLARAVYLLAQSDNDGVVVAFPGTHWSEDGCVDTALINGTLINGTGIGPEPAVNASRIGGTAKALWIVGAIFGWPTAKRVAHKDLAEAMSETRKTAKTAFKISKKMEKNAANPNAKKQA